jgi:hypothetical protein
MNARHWGFILSALWLAVFLAAYLLNLPPFNAGAFSGAFGLMILVGGPMCLLAGALLAVPKERVAGALLWLGGAVAALGIAFQSGPYLGRYFLGLALIVLPEVAAGSLFLLHARKQMERRPGPKR